VLPSYTPGVTRASLRRQVDAPKRKLAHVLPMLRLRGAANHIVKLWNIAVASQKPRPDPIDCVHLMAGTGFRPESWNPLHGYLEHCQRYRTTPDAGEITGKPFPPGKKARPVRHPDKISPGGVDPLCLYPPSIPAEYLDNPRPKA